MRIVGRHVLEEFCRKHPDTRRWVENSLADVESSVWTGPSELKGSYASASLLADNVVIFNVKGNSYRLEVSVAFGVGVVTVIWAGTHSTYERRNKRRARRR